jgi:hypothetical protein
MQQLLGSGVLLEGALGLVDFFTALSLLLLLLLSLPCASWASSVPAAVAHRC